MKKTIFFIIISLTVQHNLITAQKRSTYNDQNLIIGIAGQAGLPFGKNSSSFSYTMGGSINGELKILPSVNLLGQVGYLSFVKKNTKTNGAINYGGTIAFIEVLGGVKYFLPNDIFLTGKIGVAHSQSGGGNTLCYKPGVGYDFSRNIDIELLLSGITKAGDLGGTLSTINLKVGYFF